MNPVHEELISEFLQFSRTAPTATDLMQHIAESLHEHMTKFNWVGFYLLDPADPNFLIVGPFVGSFTGNKRIPLDTGLCGAAATSGETVVVHDVSQDPRYLSGSTMVKCEVVVPIFSRDGFAAELDIESYFAGTFEDPQEIQFAEQCAAIVGRSLKKS